MRRNGAPSLKSFRRPKSSSTDTKKNLGASASQAQKLLVKQRFQFPEAPTTCSVYVALRERGTLQYRPPTRSPYNTDPHEVPLIWETTRLSASQQLLSSFSAASQHLPPGLDAHRASRRGMGGQGQQDSHRRRWLSSERDVGNAFAKTVTVKPLALSLRCSTFPWPLPGLRANPHAPESGSVLGSTV